MATKAERISYLKEHLTYEVLMLRYTAKFLTSEANQLAWNAHFESFCVHARSLYEFLTNSGDSRNFAAKDYSTAAAQKEKMIGIVNRLNEQVMHLTKNRFTDEQKKVTLDDVRRASAWMQEKLQDFVNALREPYNKVWDEDAATPPSAGTLMVSTTGSPLTASSQPQVVGSSDPKASQVSYVVKTKE